MDHKRAHYLQHVAFEGLGSIREWLEAAGYRITGTSFFQSSILPDPDEVDLLIVMGGPMSVNDEEAFPWLAPEKRFIRDVIAKRKPVLGICLGAQLIASALGARIFKNPLKEIGWFPITGIPSDNGTTFNFPAQAQAFHWHGETFDLPSGANLLASSVGCENQAFQYGPKALGLQFHLETTPESAREIVEHCRDELIPAQYIQSEAEILSAAPERYRSINDLMDRVLAFLSNANT